MEDSGKIGQRKKLKKRKPASREDALPDPQENIIEADSIKKSTKATFDLYVEQAQANIARERKSSPRKGKSRKQKEGEEVLLENLRNSSEFQKDTDEETKKRNTYNPDESKEKSNKRRDRQRKSTTKSSSSRPPRPQQGSDNAAYESEAASRVASPNQLPADTPMNIEEISDTAKKTKSKKVKKPKRKSKDPEEEETTFIEEQENVSPDEKKKSSKKKKDKPVIEEEVVEKPEPVEYVRYTDESKIAGVILHRADKLRTNFLLQHPLVRVHIIDVDTGQHLTKRDRDRPVTSFYETMNRDETPSTILSMMTQAFDFKERRTVTPCWDEMLIFNETFNYLLQEKPNVVMFFEVLDFVSMNRASRNQSNQSIVRGEEGWHKEAWGFLKLRAANGKLNVDHQVRLQLFEVPRSRMVSGEVPVYQYWKYCVRRNYPSSLYVTIRSVAPPDVVEPAVRSMFPTQEERGTMTMKQIQEALSKSHVKDAVDDAPSNWGKLPGQMCKLPNSPLLSLPAGKMGCLVMRFSNDGRHLACGCLYKSSNPILVYEIPSGELKATLSGHYNNIYELCWSRADKFLLSASSDGTARVWNIDTQKCLKMLPHPTFVYCAKFHPRVSKVIVTGSYDNTLRVWHIDGEDLQGDLQQELDEHSSYINSMCFDEEGTKLYSADNDGYIKIWNVYVTEKATKKGVTRDWKLHSTIENEEIKDLSISYLTLHPNGRRLLIQTKDNTIRMLDLRMMTITQRYVGALNFREIVHSDITVCGTFVFSGSEDGCAYVWNTETGDQVAVYSDLNFTQTVNDVKFHPLDHIIAFSSRGDNHKVLVFKYESNWADKDAKNYYTVVSKSKHAIDKAEALIPDTDNTSPPREDMTLQIETKKRRAMKKLETVMEFNRNMDRQTQRHPDRSLMTSAPVPGTVGMTGTWSSTGDWGSTFDTTHARTVAASLGPTIMSPHARQSGDTEAVRNHLTSQMDYMRKSPTPGWRPGFSPIGTRNDRPPSMTMSMPSQGNPAGNFTLQGAEDMKPIGEVIALYDYLAQRSDELSFRRNDIISVYYKDTEQWWMGALKSTGVQGFIPSNYVESLDDGTKKPAGLSTDDIDSPAKKTTALMDKGQLKFLSGTESDASSGDNLEDDGTKRRRTRGNRMSRSRERKKNQISDSYSLVPSFDHLLE